MHLTRPPRLEGVVKEAQMKTRKKKQKEKLIKFELSPFAIIKK
jgi:hypothetical protein